MTCQERRDSILLHALNDSDADALSPSERDSIRSHLAGGCPSCNAALAEAEATLAQIPLSLRIELPPSHARDRIMQRVLAHARQQKSRGFQADSPWRMLTALAACLVIGFAATYYFVKPTYQRQVAIRDATISALQQQAAVDQKMLDTLRAESLQLVALDKTDAQAKAKGRVIWDHDRNMWHVTVFDMAPVKGRTFELWMITPDGKKHPSITFDVDANGDAMVMAPVPKDIGPIAVAAITDEPPGGVPQPTGAIHLAGKVQ